MNSEIRKQLDGKCEELCNLLFEAKGALDVLQLIGLNTSEIDRECQSYFWLVERWAIKTYTVNICMICELEGEDYPLNSIPGIIKFIKEKDISPECGAVIKDFVLSHGLPDDKADLNEISSIEAVIGTYFKGKRREFDRFKTARNKKFSHSESNFKLNGLPCFDSMEKILHFCVEIHKVILRGYINCFPHKIIEDKRFVSSVTYLLKSVGVNDLKVKFKDE